MSDAYDNAQTDKEVLERANRAVSESANPVQEAWSELELRILLVHEHICYSAKPGCPRERDPATQAAARALALATFWRWRCCHVPCTREKPCGNCAASAAEIKALGR